MNNKRNSLDRILEEQNRFTSMIESSGLNRILEEQNRFTSMIESSGLNRILEQQNRFTSIIESSGLNRILEQQNRFTSMIESNSLNQFKNIIDNINNIQSINLENIFDWNDYFEEIEDYYDDLEEICDESALYYPKNEIFFISIKNLIESIKLYFLKKVENLLKVESVDYFIWKPCLDNAISKSVNVIISLIYDLFGIIVDISTYSNEENITRQIFLCYVIVAKLNIFINEIEVNFHKELKNRGIDLEDL